MAHEGGGGPTHTICLFLSTAPTRPWSAHHPIHAHLAGKVTPHMNHHINESALVVVEGGLGGWVRS